MEQGLEGDAPHADPPVRSLLVFDDHLFGHALSQFLRLDGCCVDTAPETDATKLLVATRYHVVLADVENGLKLLRRIRLVNVALLLITDYSMIQRAHKGVQLGAFAYLIKPIIDDELRQVIQRVLQQQTRSLESSSGRQICGEYKDRWRSRLQSSRRRKPPGTV